MSVYLHISSLKLVCSILVTFGIECPTFKIVVLDLSV
jgi:hypothetical protein